MRKGLKERRKMQFVHVRTKEKSACLKRGKVGSLRSW